MPRPSTLIGIVGYSPVLDAFPLGPRLMVALEAGCRRLAGARVANMSWSPIHIVQQLQDRDAVLPDRLVLVGSASRSTAPGAVRAYRWAGGTLPDAAVQARVYAAVTGIVDIENTLMIGQYFGAWPGETYVVEVDLPADTFGRMVIADSEGRADDEALQRELGCSPAAAIRELASKALALARFGRAAEVALVEKAAEALVPVEPFIRTFEAMPSETSA